MTSEEIISFWLKKGEPITKFSASSLIGFGFQESTLATFSTIGLPADAAPFLSFNQSIDKFQSPSKYFGLENSTLERFVTIGSDGAGSPLVIDTGSNDQVLLLDHENGLAASFVNNSLHEMLACLVAYSQFVDEIISSRGDDAYLDADFTDTQFTVLQNSLLTIIGLTQLDFKKAFRTLWRPFLSSGIDYALEDNPLIIKNIFSTA